MASISARKHSITGLVLRQFGEEIIAVWSPKHPENEIFIIDKEMKFKPGDFIKFKLTDRINKFQEAAEITIVPIPRSIEIISNADSESLLISTKIGFPPAACTYFDEEIFATLDYGVAFYCFSPEFGKIVSYVQLDFRPGSCYKAIISRIPIENDWLIQKTGTMFAVWPEQTLEEIREPREVERLSGFMPWNRMQGGDESNARQNGSKQRKRMDELDRNSSTSSHIVPANDPPPNLQNGTNAEQKIASKPHHPLNLIDSDLAMFIDQINRPSPSNIATNSATVQEPGKSARGMAQKQTVLHNDFGDEVTMEKKEADDDDAEICWLPKNWDKPKGTSIEQSDCTSSAVFPFPEVSSDTVTTSVQDETPRDRSPNIPEDIGGGEGMSLDKIVSFVSQTLIAFKTQKTGMKALLLEQKLISICHEMQDELKKDEAKDGKE